MLVIIKKIFVLSLLVLIYSSSFGDNETNSLLKQLDNMLDQRIQFDQKKESRLKELKSFIADPNISSDEKYHFQNKLIGEYEAYKFDSVIYYISQNKVLAQELQNNTMLNKTRIQLSRILAGSGRYKESFDVLAEINRNILTKDLLKDYFSAFVLTYNELIYHSQVLEYTKQYENLYTNYVDSLLSTLQAESDEYLSIVEEQKLYEGNPEACLEINTKRLKNAKLGDRNYSIITFQRALAYEYLGKLEHAKKFFILSAISDIQGSIKDNASLAKLALLLFNEGDINRAYRYINISFEDADFFNSKLRLINISNILPVINAAFQNESEKQKSRLRIYLIIISILFVGLASSFLFIYKQMKKLSLARSELQGVNRQLKSLNNELLGTNKQLIALNNELSETNHVKEQYIGNFLNICSNYIDKLENFRKTVNKKLANKKYIELYEMTKSKQIVDLEIEEFYTNFDNTFLHIYPDFVEELNALLKKDEVIILKKDEVLNTELRIYALIRLGITDSSKIAELLRYSVNTIYNYRVKIKNKAAIARDEFEDHIKKIGSFSK